ncbi:MAG: hypothetical protein Q9161_008343 [Pseudevernia consocians]
MRPHTPSWIANGRPMLLAIRVPASPSALLLNGEYTRCLSVAAKAALSHSHDRAVQRIAASVRDFYDRKKKFRIYHGSTNSTRQSTITRNNYVDTSPLSHVLRVNPEDRTALVEPNVPMDRLVEETMKYGLIPPVVMEFPGITVGGGYAGTSGESSSFKHGFFNRTINNVEMVLANGKVLNCSDSENADLFHGAAGALGSLGVTTRIELQLCEAKKYVETTYYPVSSIVEAIEKIEEVTADPEVDHVDGILFSKTKGAVMAGRMTDTQENTAPINCFSDANDSWFYLHVKNVVSGKKDSTTELIPLAEYLFRYDRGGFWVGALAFDYFKMPFNNFTRWWLDDFLHTRMMYTALHASGQSKKCIIQDLVLSYSTAEQFVEYTDRAFGIWPLWLCPLRQSPQPTMHPHLKEIDSNGQALKPMLNIGLYGWGPSQPDEFVKANRDLERKVRELGGMKWLYAQTYYDEEEFWDIYDREWYDALREKYDAAALPSAYDKVKAAADGGKQAIGTNLGSRLGSLWPFSGFYGIKKAIDSGAYLAARSSAWRSIGERDRFGTKR